MSLDLPFFYPKRNLNSILFFPYIWGCLQLVTWTLPITTFLVSTGGVTWHTFSMRLTWLNILFTYNHSNAEIVILDFMIMIIKLFFFFKKIWYKNIMCYVNESFPFFRPSLPAFCRLYKCSPIYSMWKGWAANHHNQGSHVVHQSVILKH